MSDNLKIPRIQNPSNCDKLDVRKVSFNLFFIHVVLFISLLLCSRALFLFRWCSLVSEIEPVLVCFIHQYTSRARALSHMKWYRQFDTVCQRNWHDDEIYNRCNRTFCLISDAIFSIPDHVYDVDSMKWHVLSFILTQFHWVFEAVGRFRAGPQFISVIFIDNQTQIARFFTFLTSIIFECTSRVHSLNRLLFFITWNYWLKKML